ncbi:hypothetical protein KJ567_06060 [Candidatus Bipolaricaulota bacterium]|nr:hypothetical protein [Candidatus Bipolaricaulota bacterium]
MTSSQHLPTRDVLRTWWPLAASWILMALEGPALNIVVARLVDPRIHLAAYGSLVFPLALLIEAPIIMLLAASTALCKDWTAYRKMRRFMHTAGAALTVLHGVVAFTPLYGLLARDLLGVPEEIIGPGRIGLMVMLPWTWAIAYRRFNQGVLIRFGHSIVVGIGTGIRLLANVSVLAVGFALQSIPGTTVATSAIIAGVLSEAVYVGLRVRPVLRTRLPKEAADDGLTYAAFFRFYVPLSLTSIIFLGARPILTAAISRMPNALDSLAVLPVITGLTFLLRSAGVAFSEVVIAHLDTRDSARTLRRFAFGLMGATTAGMLLVATTPLSRIWFGTITGLPENLIDLARGGLWFALLLPALSALQSWFQGIVLHSRRTRSITEAVLVYLLASTAMLIAGIQWGAIAGAYVGLGAMTVGELARTAWLGWRGRCARLALWERDSGSPSEPTTAPR